MAELLPADEWPEPGSLEVDLRDFLPEGFFVLPDLTVHGQAIDLVVVGPQGLVVLHVRDWAGEVLPAQRGPWSVQLDGGQVEHHPNPADAVRKATAALQAFLHDEFPALHPAIHHLLVLTSPAAHLAAAGPAEMPVVSREMLAGTLVAMAPPAEGSLSDDGSREVLAGALRERRLSAGQRAKQPFVFRSGGLFGSGKKVWTVRAAVRQMDRRPEDGIYHLGNGTLAQWLSEQGAEHLAALAGEVIHTRETDPRVPLEMFLLGTGLVDRPRLVVRPGRVQLGCVLSGESRSGRIQIRRGRGRGYLFGTLHTSEPWLRADPRSFSGGPFESVVNCDTATLPISRKPWRAAVLVESSASAAPIAVPVRVRVVGMPSQLNRVALRPLAGAAAAGLLGMAVGWAHGSWGPGAEAGLPGDAALPAPLPLAWAAVVGLFWAALGGLRGWLQPVSWPLSYALGRWLTRTLVWGMVLSVLAVMGHWAWRQLNPRAGAGASEISVGSLILLVLALAIVPAVVGEIGAARQIRATSDRPMIRSLLRPVLLASAGIALVVILVAGVLVLRSVWGQPEVSGRLNSAGSWAEERWAQLEAGINDQIDQVILHYYDRRAPPQPALTPTPTAGATPATATRTP